MPGNLWVARVCAWRVASAGLSCPRAPTGSSCTRPFRAAWWGGPHVSLVPHGHRREVRTPQLSLARPRLGLDTRQSKGAGPAQRRTWLQTLEPRPALGVDSCDHRAAPSAAVGRELCVPCEGSRGGGGGATGPPRVSGLRAGKMAGGSGEVYLLRRRRKLKEAGRGVGAAAWARETVY